MTKSSKNPSLYKSSLRGLILIFCLAAIYYSKFSDKAFLATYGTDGFTSQVRYVINQIEIGASLSDLEPLLWIHLLRAGVAIPFEYLENIGGIWLSTLVILVLFIPVISLFERFPRSYVALLIPIFVVLLSSRAALGALSIGYLILFLFLGSSVVFLIASFILANLSSGVMLNCLLLALVMGARFKPRSKALWIYIFLSIISFTISAVDKYAGFTSGASGYDATVYGASGIEAVLSRSTIFVSLLTANYARAIGYIVLAAFAVFLFTRAMRDASYRGYGLIFLCSVPSFLFEGLGAMSLAVPFMMFLAGAMLPMSPTSLRPEGHRNAGSIRSDFA